MRCFCGSVALVLCLAGAADAQAAGPSIDSAYTGFDTKTCPHRAGRDVEDCGKVLVVTRLGPGGVCHVGYVDGLASPNASELARRIADDRARSFRCDTDRPIIAGETGPGFSSSATAEKAELKRIPN